MRVAFNYYLLLLWTTLHVQMSLGITLDGELKIASHNIHLLGRMAKFNQNDEGKLVGPLVTPDSENPYLCHKVKIAIGNGGEPLTTGSIVLVPRGGNCTFEKKALVAQEIMGAIGMIVYNTLESRYGWNETSTSVHYPKDSLDYECQNGGVAVISTEQLTLDPPRYKTELHDDSLVLSSSTNLCELQEPNDCDSQRCLVTGPPVDSNQTNSNQEWQACCAWDLHITMGHDDSIQQETNDDFLSMFVTMEQGVVLNDLLLDNDMVTEVTLKTRAYPKFNVSSFLLWLLAIGVTTFSALYSIKDYRRVYSTLHNYMERIRHGVLEQGPNFPLSGDEVTVAESQEAEHEEEQHHDCLLEATTPQGPLAAPLPSATETSTLMASPKRQEDLEEFHNEGQECNVGNDEEQQHPNQSSTMSSTDPLAQSASPTQLPLPLETSPNTSQRQTASRAPPLQQQASSSPFLELTVWHAIGFVVIATSVLLLLFFFEFYNAVAVLYALGTSSAVAQLIFSPIFRLVKCCSCPLLGWNKCMDLGVSCGDFMALVCGYTLGGVWLYVGFTTENPSTNSVFFWTTQNLMASCACIMFLSVIRLSSIKVATALLVAAFLYDIFFVFITPYIFDGESVMVTVATSGGGGNGDSSSDENFCTKYPDDSDCQGGTVLPLVFTIPRINDYRGGSSLLGLGDVVLPGLLIAFGARLDQAKRLSVLIGMADDVTNPPTKWYHGYLVPLLLAYALGLMFAYIAVRFMERGQPALLYIVPMCLGTTVICGRCELSKLWKGPPELERANKLVTYCDAHPRQFDTLPNMSLSVQGGQAVGGADAAVPGSADNPTDSLASDSNATRPLT